MTNEEKITKLALMLPEAGNGELTTLLNISESVVLNQRYPFGYPDGTTVEPRYENIQLQIAVEMYNRAGAEGQLMHTENGITRTYESAYVSTALLRRIMPYAGVPGGASR